MPSRTKSGGQFSRICRQEKAGPEDAVESSSMPFSGSRQLGLLGAICPQALALGALFINASRLGNPRASSWPSSKPCKTPIWRRSWPQRDRRSPCHCWSRDRHPLEVQQDHAKALGQRPLRGEASDRKNVSATENVSPGGLPLRQAGPDVHGLCAFGGIMKWLE